MGVSIGGVWHEELADPGSGSYENTAAYNQEAGPASQQGGENLNWGQGGGGGGGGGGGAAGAGAAGANQYGAAIQQALDALASGNREAFQRAMYEFDQTFGLDKDKFAEDVRQYNQNFGVTQAGLTGQYQGAPTLPALTSYANQFGQWGVPQTGAQTLAAQAQNAGLYGYNPTLGANGVPIGANGQPLTTLAAQQQAYAQQMGMISQAATLQANPFRQQQAIGQMGNLLGGQGVAGFSAPNTVAGVGVAGGNTRGGMGYLQQMIDDIRDPSANQASMNQVMQGIPTPNKLNSTEFLRAAPSTQSMVLQGMQEKYGLDPADSLKQIQATMPQFNAPTTLGGIKR